MVDAILDGAAQLCEDVLAPLNHSGDIEGCKLENGAVTTPKGFKEAYDQFVEGGWQGLSPRRVRRPGPAHVARRLQAEMMGTANWSFNMYPGLSLGAMNTIMLHGTEEQRKAQYMPPLTEGRWMGTMCLTEPQCGTDLGAGQAARPCPRRRQLRCDRHQDLHLRR
jgi:alkylation response protein AidB-like acyl-CoA dehydrogenase